MGAPITRQQAAALVEAVILRLTVPLEASGRHVHLTRADLDALFAPGYVLTPAKALSQPGQFACRERVTLLGPKGALENVVILGPERRESQAEISLTDAAALGVAPPVRRSGSLAETPGIRVRNGTQEITLPQGLIIAKRHVHLTPEDATRFGVTDGQTVRLKCGTARPLVFDAVEVRVSSRAATAAHLDYDEANACGFRKGDRARILP